MKQRGFIIPRRIDEDHADFRNIISGKLRKELKKFISSGAITRTRGKNGKITISIPKIDIPRIVFGESDEGFARGSGKDGDVIGKSDKDSQSGEGEGILINLSLDEVLKFMQDELHLPNIKRKDSEIFEDVRTKYNNISIVGPDSLRHNKRTLIQTCKRQAAEGTLNKLKHVPGLKDPIRVLQPISEDKRFKQFKEIKTPSNNALIVFARDGSASMDKEKCDIVSDMSWWIDCWIRRFYDRVDRFYVWHDSTASEVDEERFYKYRYGGGTTCSSALKYISKQFENRYPPDKWNIYVIYFTDGENWEEDNQVFINTLKEDFRPDVVNFTGIVQILSNSYSDSIKKKVDESIQQGLLDKDYVRTVSIGPEDINSSGPVNLSLEDKNKSILEAIKKLLGKVEK